MSMGEAISREIQVLNVLPGYLCNFSCDHCASSSSPSNSLEMSDSDISEVLNVFASAKVHRLLFTGGEPTLYAEKINHIVQQVLRTHQPKVGITTNGWFGSKPSRVSDKLDKIEVLDFLQVSIDGSHQQNGPVEIISNIKSYCEHRGVEFAVVSSILGLHEFDLISRIQSNCDVKVNVQKVGPVGRAKKTGSFFKFNRFDTRSADQKCPNRNNLTFAPKRGFSKCCANLMFDHKFSQVATTSWPKNDSEEFDHLLEAKTLSEIADYLGVKIDNTNPALSDPCTLCESIFVQKYGGSKC